MREKTINLLLQVRKEDSSKRRRELKMKESILIYSTKKESTKQLPKKVVNSTSSLRIIFFIFIIFFMKISFISCEDIISINPFEKKNFILNEANRYVIYKFENSKIGTIHTYFDYGNILSTKVTVYYDKNKIYYDKNKEEFVNYDEQKNLYKTSNLTFNSFNGNMYFVISNFIRDITDNIHIINNLGFYDITNKETFKYLYKFNLTEKVWDKRNITFSFDNNIKKKNYLYYQIDYRNSISDLSEIITNKSKQKLKIIKLNENTGMVDLSHYKNETININISINSYWEVINSFELLIYYSDYKNTFSIINEENSYAFIPSIIKHQYFIFADLDKAYDNILLFVETKYITNFSGKYYFYESNKIQEILDILPDSKSKDGIDIISSSITNYLYEIKLIRNIKYDKSVLFQINTSQDAKFKVKFFNPKYIYTFKNITFNLSYNQKYIIYQFYNPKDDFIYIYVKNGNMTSTGIYFYNNSYDIHIDNNNRVLNYNEKYNLNSNIFKFYAIKGYNYILFSNFEENYSDIFYIIIPHEYYDITQNDTFQFFYKITNQENNMILTLSFNNTIKKKFF